MYLLPLVFFFHKSIDTMETKFLNYYNAPIMSLL